MWGTNKDGNLMNLPEKVERPTLVDWRSVLDGKNNGKMSLNPTKYINIRSNQQG